LNELIINSILVKVWLRLQCYLTYENMVHVEHLFSESHMN
jgi:hypothetical protein